MPLFAQKNRQRIQRWDGSSAGRASASHAGGHGFEPRPPHERKAFKINVFVDFEGFFHALMCTTSVLSKYFAGCCPLRFCILCFVVHIGIQRSPTEFVQVHLHKLWPTVLSIVLFFSVWRFRLCYQKKTADAGIRSLFLWCVTIIF